MNNVKRTPPEWTGALLGRMHNAGITQRQLAERLGIGKAYMTMIFRGERQPKDIEKRCNEAFTSLVCEKVDVDYS